MRDRFDLSGFRLRDQAGDIGLRSNDFGDRIREAALREPNKVFAFLHSAIEHTTREPSASISRSISASSVSRAFAGA